jgi:hypothetical protein
MIYYILNGLFIGIVSIFEYRRYKLIKSLKKIDLGIYARFEWTGWHKIKDPSKKWSVFFKLKEIGKSRDGSKTQFKVLEIFSENSDENQESDLSQYKKELYNTTGGGWLDTNNKNLFYFGESKSIWEERNRKLEALGIK